MEKENGEGWKGEGSGNWIKWFCKVEGSGSWKDFQHYSLEQRELEAGTLNKALWLIRGVNYCDMESV